MEHIAQFMWCVRRYPYSASVSLLLGKCLLFVVAPEAAGGQPRAARAERVEGELHTHRTEVGQHEAV